MYIALFSHFILCGVHEAVYILDGLIRKGSEIQPDTIHGDTHWSCLHQALYSRHVQAASPP
jgi:hypothetical protein